MGLPIVVVLVWVGFLVCMGVIFSSRMMKTSFQRRMQQALSPSDEEIEDLAQEQRTEEMSKSLGHRLLAPVLKKMAAKSQSKAQLAGGQLIRDMLEQAGHPLDMHYPEFMALKLFCLIFFVGVGIVSSFFAVPLILNILMGGANDPTIKLMFSALWVMVFAFVGYSGPTFWLRRLINQRIRQIRKSMADVVDLIVLAIEAGLGFNQALDQAIQKTTGPLTDELRRVADEIRVGRQQGDAFRGMALRVKMPELSLLVAAIDQATRMGTGLAGALRLQGTEIRERRMAMIKEAAGKLPVKMMLPLVFFIFPALFVIILGPAAVQMSEMSNSGQLGMFGG